MASSPEHLDLIVVIRKKLCLPKRDIIFWWQVGLFVFFLYLSFGVFVFVFVFLVAVVGAHYATGHASMTLPLVFVIKWLKFHSKGIPEFSLKGAATSPAAPPPAQ